MKGIGWLWHDVIDIENVFQAMLDYDPAVSDAKALPFADEPSRMAQGNTHGT